MSYQNVYDYVKDISQNLDIGVRFVHANQEWLNFQSPDQGITLWSLPFSSSYNFNNETQQIQRVWTIPLTFYQQDKPDGEFDQDAPTQQQQSIKTLALTDLAVERFVRQFSSNAINDDLERASDLLNVTGATTGAAIMDTDYFLTGTVLTLTVEFADRFDYCCLDGVR